jgi:biopolymer transport protein ExbD
MKQSARAKRMARLHKRMNKQSKLSLVSLMDIFTILVFFLMLNASDVQVLQAHKSLTLPKSSADTPAEETLLILVNGNDLMLQGQRLANVEQVLNAEDDVIAPLAKELAYRASRSSSPGNATNDATHNAEIERAITIMGDAEVPYALLKKIMQTCAQEGYTNIALAVEYQQGASA